MLKNRHSKTVTTKEREREKVGEVFLFIDDSYPTHFFIPIMTLLDLGWYPNGPTRHMRI